MSISSEKATLRNALIEVRNTLNSSENSNKNQIITEEILRIPEVKSARVVCVYVSIRGEVDTRNLIDRLATGGCTVVVPRIISKAEMRAVEFTGWQNTAPGPLRIPAPISEIAWASTIDVAIVPGLGFGKNGARLGFGAGYYDRWLATQGEMTKIGVCYAVQLLDHVPTATHDVPMDMIVTEIGASSRVAGET